jgi:CDP-diacylglycerol--glycerol-3-phosphate 3-phosphatidyltransferase/cardiolipin synthase
MGAYRFADLWNVPNLLSLTRLPLAVAFTRVRSPAAALGILGAAGLSDVLDGWYARRFDQQTATGAVVDPITDKVFVGTVVATLLSRRQLPLWAVPLLGAREIGELPLVAWFAVSRTARGARAQQARANVPGKVATLLQFGTVTCALFGSRAFVPLALFTGGAGVVAAVSYWRRWLEGE